MPILTLLSSAGAFAGAGGVAVAVSALSSSGTERLAGTATVALTVAGLSSAGSERVTGSGSEALSVPSFTNAGDEDFRATGSETFAVSALSASGVERIAGSGTTSTSVDTSSGTARERVIGSGSESFTVAGCSASGSFNGSGAGTSALTSPGLSGSGQERIQGSGSFVVSAPSILAISGSNAGAGDCSFGGPAIIGAGSQHAARPSSDESGGGAFGSFVRWGPKPNGTPRKVSPPSVTGTPAITGRATCAIPLPQLDASGSIGISGSGRLAIHRLECVGSGKRTVPVFTGAASLSSTTSFTGIGIQDLLPVEEEEIALFLAACA